MCGHLVVVDLDTPVAEIAARLRERAFSILGPTRLERIGAAPKLALLYRIAEPIQKLRTPELFLPDDTKLQVEILGQGQQMVAFGIHPVTRQLYRWPDLSPLDHPFGGLPEVIAAALEAFRSEAEGLLRLAGATPKGKEAGAAGCGSAPSRRPARADDSAYPPRSRGDIADALRAVPNIHDWDGWHRIGATIFDTLGDDGEDLFFGWSAQSPKHDPQATRAKWRSFRTSPATVKAATLFYEARQRGWRPAHERMGSNSAPPQEEPRNSGSEAVDAEVELTEHGVALAFSRRHADALRYCHTADAWYVWTGFLRDRAPRNERW